MANALAMRATSFVASAVLLGAAVLAALTATWVVERFDITDGAPPITIADAPVEPPPAPPVRRDTPPPPDDAIVVDTAPPQTFTDTSEPATSSDLVFTPREPMNIENPRWLERPRNLARYYPRRALAREMEGSVSLDCLVATTGRLSCVVISETPRGWDFGDAALAIAADHRMAPAMRDGMAVEGRYRMRVPFELE